MKLPGLILSFTLCLSLGNSLFAQKKNVLKAEFYGLPINASAESLINKIKSDQRFTTEYYKYNRSTFFYNRFRSRIKNNHALLNNILTDSACIEINAAIGMYKKGGAKTGQLTIITIHYYTHKKENAEAIFGSIWSRMRSLSKDTADQTVGYREKEDFQYGKSLWWGKQVRLPSLSLLRNDGPGLFKISLIYERKGD